MEITNYHIKCNDECKNFRFHKLNILNASWIEQQVFATHERVKTGEVKYDVRCKMYDVRCGMYDVGCTMWNVRYRI